MDNLQSQPVKNLICFFIALCFGVSGAVAQSLAPTLSRADSLFELKKYTESFEQYEAIFNEGMATPQMLMKMAFIKEGLDEYPDALFYLTKYYELTQSRLALSKIREIAEAQGLVGYEVSDAAFFLRWYSMYYEHLLTALMTVIFVLLLAQLLRFFKGKEFSTGLMTWKLIFGIALAVVVNYPFQQSEAIIAEPATYLMKGPSAGAPMLEIVSQGHKVKVLDEGQVWTKIQWRDAEVFVRTGSLRRLG